MCYDCWFFITPLIFHKVNGHMVKYIMFLWFSPGRSMIYKVFQKLPCDFVLGSFLLSSRAFWVILFLHFHQYRHGAQSSFRSSIESHSLGYYSSVYRNFEWVQPRRNSPAPAVHNMSAGGTAVNGMQGWSLEMNAVPLPEQTSTYSYICPSSGSLQSHPLPVNFHRHRVQDGNIVTPPECLRSDINPFW